MAIAILNPRYKHLRGAIGNIVVKHYGDKVVLTCKPVFRNRTFSPEQKACQQRFRQAALLAKRLMADPRVRRAYEEEARAKRKPARCLIIADLLRVQIQADSQARPVICVRHRPITRTSPGTVSPGLKNSLRGSGPVGTRTREPPMSYSSAALVIVRYQSSWIDRPAGKYRNTLMHIPLSVRQG